MSGSRSVKQHIDMRAFARGAGPNLTFASGSTVFNKGDAGNCMYVCSRG